MFDSIKFFQKDVISGSAKNVGDEFTAEFFGGPANFTVVEMVDTDMFFAKLED